MKIYSMTATFGKLEHETIALTPGLNILEAPNEWGKSTWCAFLVNMLYGLDTRAKSTKTLLADKERYAPWSGAPMSGRIDLNWDGRDITIERQSKGRLIFGVFRAYETATGVDVPELDGANCGAKLLGVERSVFTRAGFLRLSDLPVTQDDALRRRLNDLVTTGDESGAGDRLQKSLKDLKNKCRYNKSGLLPQAEEQRDRLEGQLQELESLTVQADALRLRQSELEQRIALLDNHKAALRYEAAQADAARVAQALEAQQTAEELCARLHQECTALPSQREAEEALQKGRGLQQQIMSLQMEQQMLPPLPTPPTAAPRYAGLSPEAAVALAEADEARFTRSRDAVKKQSPLLWLLSAAALAAGAAGLFLQMGFGIPALIGGGALLTAAAIRCALTARRNRRLRRELAALEEKYAPLLPGSWAQDARDALAAQQGYAREYRQALSLRGDLDTRQAALNKSITDFSGELSLPDRLARWQDISGRWNALEDALRAQRLAQNHAASLAAMAKTAEPAAAPDELAYTEAETDGFLQSARFELKQLQLRLGQTQGRAEALGQEAALRTQLKTVTRRIHQLEDTYAALELAQNALSAASTELQRRFAPRISKRAQELFSRLTGGRYQRLTLSEDLTLNTCTREEDALRAAQWRSDGTVDQLYLALRLAVAEELTPEAPLVLDDALVRFDDARLAAAMDILTQTAQNKQVILFTCQGREQALGGKA